jgi:hypothetical protein
MWTLANWAGITETSQPYYPSTTNLVAADPAPDSSLLEVPDNGCLVDYMNGKAMVAVFNQNWPDKLALPAPRVFQVGMHPPDFYGLFLSFMEIALTEVDKHLYTDDAGPVRYARLIDLKKVWP